MEPGGHSRVCRRLQKYYSSLLISSSSHSHYVFAITESILDYPSACSISAFSNSSIILILIVILKHSYELNTSHSPSQPQHVHSKRLPRPHCCHLVRQSSVPRRNHVTLAAATSLSDHRSVESFSSISKSLNIFRCGSQKRPCVGW